MPPSPSPPSTPSPPPDDPAGARSPAADRYRNPFYHGKEVRGEHFFDRSEELRVLTGLLVGEPPYNVALVGQRRIGKTSLMLALAEALAADTIPVFIRCEQELYPHRPGAFALHLVSRISEALEAAGRMAWGRRLARRVREALPSQLGLGYGDLQLWARWREQEPGELVKRAFGLLARVREITGLKPVVFMDEFQELFDFGPDFLWALRSHISESPASFVVSSSALRFAARLRETSHPFFNFFDLRRVGPIAHAETRAFVQQRLARSDFEMSEAALARLVAEADGHPFYLQLLAGSACEAAFLAGATLIDEQVYRQGFERALERIPPHLSGQFQRLQGRTRDLFRALCAGYQRVGELARVTAMSPSSASQLLRQLAAGYELIEKVARGRYRVVDRLLAEWVRREFPVEPPAP